MKAIEEHKTLFAFAQVEQNWDFRQLNPFGVERDLKTIATLRRGAHDSTIHHVKTVEAHNTNSLCSCTQIDQN